MSTQQIIQGDCLEVLKTMPDKSVDLIVTDPPYGMSFQSNYRMEKHKKIVGDGEFPLWIFDEFNRIARRAVYVFCRWDNLSDIPKPKSVLAWIKNNWSMGDLLHEHGRQWEAIAFYPLEDHEFNKRIPDVLRSNRTGNNFHPTEKPTDLLYQIISANKCNSILDPFMGSGATLIAAKQLNIDATGIEIDLDYCKIAQERLDTTTLPML